MDSLNNLLGRIGSALGFGGSQQTPTTQQTTSSGVGSVNNQLMPQSLDQLPMAPQRTGPDLSPRAYDPSVLVQNLGNYVNQRPTIDYDFLGSLPNLQTPQGVFNQQTQQVENRQGQAIGTPVQPIPEVPVNNFAQATQVQQQDFTPKLGGALTGMGSVLQDVQFNNLQSVDQNLTPEKNPTPEIKESLNSSSPLFKKESTTISSVDPKVEEAIKSSGEKNFFEKALNIASIVNPINLVEKLIDVTTPLARQVAALAYATGTTDATYDVYQSLSKEDQVALNPQISKGSGLDGNFLGLQRVTEIYNTNATETEKVIAIRKEFPGFNTGRLGDIMEKVQETQEDKNRRIAAIQGLEYKNVTQIAKEQISEGKRIYNNNRKVVEDIVKSYIVTRRGVGTDPITTAQMASELNSELNRTTQQVINAAVSVNSMLEKNPDVNRGTLFPKIDDDTINKMVSRQTDVYKWTAEAGANGLDSGIFIKDKLKSMGYDGQFALRDYTLEVVEQFIEQMPEGPEKTQARSKIAGSSSQDDALKSIEIIANINNSNNVLKIANALYQDISLELVNVIKTNVAASVLSDSIGSQSLNAEQDLSYVDFTENGLGLWKHYVTDFASVGPELTAGVAELVLANAAGVSAGRAAGGAINFIGRKANYLGKLIPSVEFGGNVPSAIKTAGRYGNNLVQGGIRQIPRFANELTQELLVSSSVQAFIPGTNTQEEYDNMFLGLGLAAIIESVGPVRRLVKYGIPTNSYGLSYIDEAAAEEIVRNARPNKIINDQENERYLDAMAKMVDEQNITPDEANVRVGLQPDLYKLSQEEKAKIVSDEKGKYVSLDEVTAAKIVHQDNLNRLEQLYKNNPKRANDLTKRAYVQSKINEIYKTSIDSVDEELKLAKLIDIIGGNVKMGSKIGNEGADRTLVGQLQLDLNTVLPVRFGSQINNSYNVSTDLLSANNSPIKGYSVPSDTQEKIGNIDFYKPLDDTQFAKLSEIGISIENSENLFTKTDEGYLITGEGINKIGIIDQNNTILRSQVTQTGEDKAISELIKSTLGDEALSLVQRTNAIDNIYNSIKNLC